MWMWIWRRTHNYIVQDIHRHIFIHLSFLFAVCIVRFASHHTSNVQFKVAIQFYWNYYRLQTTEYTDNRIYPKRDEKRKGDFKMFVCWFTTLTNTYSRCNNFCFTCNTYFACVCRMYNSLVFFSAMYLCWINRNWVSTFNVQRWNILWYSCLCFFLIFSNLNDFLSTFYCFIQLKRKINNDCETTHVWNSCFFLGKKIQFNVYSVFYSMKNLNEFIVMSNLSKNSYL